MLGTSQRETVGIASHQNGTMKRVEVALPVDQAVAAGVGDQDVQAGAAERAVLVGRVRVRAGR